MANSTRKRPAKKPAKPYRERITDARLQTVVAYVHSWLFDGKSTT